MRNFRVTLYFSGSCAWSTQESALNIPGAIDAAIRYARALGWKRPITKKTVIEVPA